MIVNAPMTTDPAPPRSAVLFLGNATAIAIKRRWAIGARHAAPPPGRVFPEVHAHPLGLDVALLRLAERTESFVPLAEPGALAIGTPVIMAGWGKSGTGLLAEGPIAQVDAYSFTTARNTISGLTDLYAVTRFDDEPNEGQLQSGDSGGGLFVETPAGLRLAAIGNSIGQRKIGFASLGDTSYCMLVASEVTRRWIAAVTGDLDNDGDVDAADFSIIAQRFGTPGYDAELFAAFASRFGD